MRLYMCVIWGKAVLTDSEEPFCQRSRMSYYEQTEGEKLVFFCPGASKVFIPLITTHTHMTAPIPHHNTQACVRLIPVIHQWTSPWSGRLISHQFIWLVTVFETWAVCLFFESCSHYSPTVSWVMDLGFDKWDKTIQIFAQYLVGKWFPGSWEKL